MGVAVDFLRDLDARVPTPPRPVHPDLGVGRVLDADLRPAALELAAAHDLTVVESAHAYHCRWVDAHGAYVVVDGRAPAADVAVAWAEEILASDRAVRGWDNSTRLARLVAGRLAALDFGASPVPSSPDADTLAVLLTDRLPDRSYHPSDWALQYAFRQVRGLADLVVTARALTGSPRTVAVVLPSGSGDSPGRTR